MASSDLLAESEPVLKDWTMKRNCSVSPRQFVWFYVSLAVFSLLIAFMLDLIGAWLVLPFTGIELWRSVSLLQFTRVMLWITNASGCFRTGS
jgi:uncharacterized membrane protein